MTGFEFAALGAALAFSLACCAIDEYCQDRHQRKVDEAHRNYVLQQRGLR